MIQKSYKNNTKMINFVYVTKENILIIHLVFISQSYFALPKNIRLNSMHYLIMKIPNKRKLRQIAF